MKNDLIYIHSYPLHVPGPWKYKILVINRKPVWFEMLLFKIVYSYLYHPKKLSIKIYQPITLLAS